MSRGLGDVYKRQLYIFKYIIYLLLFIMYSTLRSPLFFKTKITTNHTAIYRKKKAFHKAFGKNDRFFTTNKTFESPQTKALFFLQQKLHQPPTKAPPTTNRSSANHQQSIRSIPTPSPASWKKKKTAICASRHPLFIHTRPHGTTPLAHRTGTAYLYRNLKR